MEHAVFPERRAVPRHLAAENCASLVWWEGAKVRRSWTRLLDVSRDGALLAAAGPPSPDQSIWLRLDEPTETAWVSAKVVRRDASDNVGVSFLGSCRPLFDAVALEDDFEGLLDAYG